MPTAEEPNIERLLAPFRREKLDRVPNFEEHVNARLVSQLPGKEAVDSQMLPPADAMQYTRRTGQDVIWLQVEDLMGKRGSVQTLEDAEK